MTEKKTPEAPAVEAPADPLQLLRRPFPDHQISKLPKETGKQAQERKKAQDAGSWPPKCTVCGGYHHAKAVHLDYVGHAALTDRLLDTDINWSWEPVALDQNGLPALDGNRGLWIRLTVCGVTRLGYGSADGKTGGDAVKELIGDALRNAAMRFGAALDLWHKGDLHAPEEAEDDDKPKPQNGGQADHRPSWAERADRLEAALRQASPDDLPKAWEKGAQLLATLSTEDPDRLAAITALYEQRRDIPF